MKKTELKEYIGKFGKISGGAKGFEKTLYGKIMHVDIIGAVYFVDNEEYGHWFPKNQINSFDEQEFKDKS
jgi:hypothetical protein